MAIRLVSMHGFTCKCFRSVAQRVRRLGFCPDFQRLRAKRSSLGSRVSFQVSLISSTSFAMHERASATLALTFSSCAFKMAYIV